MHFPGNLWLLQFWHELTKLFARKRTFIGFGAFLALEILALYFFNLRGPREHFRHLIERGGDAFDEYYSGLTVSLLIVQTTVFLLGGLYLALVAGDVVSKDVEEGTMRMMLCRPVSRTRLLAIKYCACIVYTFSLAVFIGLSSLAAGMIFRGWGGLFVADPFALYSPHDGLARFLSALPFLGCSMLTIASLGFMFSCFNMKPAAATIVTLSIIFFDLIFQKLPAFVSLKPYFISTHMSAWAQIFVPRIPWRSLGMDYIYLAALNVTCVVIGMVNFNQRDFKS